MAPAPLAGAINRHTPRYLKENQRTRSTMNIANSITQHAGAYRIGSLCTGYGGLDIAVQNILGGTLTWVSDIDTGASKILAHHHPSTPNLGDLTLTDWSAIAPVDILTAGYPCQPFSQAGQRKGTADDRHIWPHIAHALRVLRPRIAVFENVANHLRLGFSDVLADLAAIGFDAEWCVVGASEVGAPHRRNRLFILAWDREQPLTPADTPSIGHDGTRAARKGRHGLENSCHATSHSQEFGRGERRSESAGIQGGPVTSGCSASDWGAYEHAIRHWEHVTGRSAPWATDDRGRLSPAFVEWMMGLPEGHVAGVGGMSRTQQIKALGNGVLPQQAEAALHLLLKRCEEN